MSRLARGLSEVFEVEPASEKRERARERYRDRSKATAEEVAAVDKAEVGGVIDPKPQLSRKPLLRTTLRPRVCSTSTLSRSCLQRCARSGW